MTEKWKPTTDMIDIAYKAFAKDGLAQPEERMAAALIAARPAIAEEAMEQVAKVIEFHPYISDDTKIALGYGIRKLINKAHGITEKFYSSTIEEMNND